MNLKNNKKARVFIYTFVIIMFIACVGIGISYFALKDDFHIPNQVKQVLEYTWNVFVLINMSFIPLKIINTLYTSIKNVKEFKAKKPLKIKESVVKTKILKENIFNEIDNILDSSLPDHVKRQEIKNIISERKK